MLVYTPLNEVDNLTMDGPSRNYDVQEYYNKYCKAALEHEDPKRNKHSGIVKVVKHYAAAGVHWYETHRPEEFKEVMKDNTGAEPHITLLCLLTMAELTLMRAAPPSSVNRNVTLSKQVLL